MSTVFTAFTASTASTVATASTASTVSTVSKTSFNNSVADPGRQDRHASTSVKKSHTRMHSRKMRCVRCSGRPGGVSAQGVSARGVSAKGLYISPPCGQNS